jgi:hypothetical protein
VPQDEGFGAEDVMSAGMAERFQRQMEILYGVYRISLHHLEEQRKEGRAAHPDVSIAKAKTPPPAALNPAPKLEGSRSRTEHPALPVL